MGAFPGAVFTTSLGHEAWISGDGKLVVYPRISEMTEEIKIVKDSIPGLIETGRGSLELDLTDSLQIDPHLEVAQIDLEKISFPLTLRTPKDGDKFQPLGMGGHSQKLQDYFVNQKFSPNDKRSQLILVNGNGEIIWVVGKRLDERYRITENTTEVLKINFV